MTFIVEALVGSTAAASAATATGSSVAAAMGFVPASATAGAGLMGYVSGGLSLASAAYSIFSGIEQGQISEMNAQMQADAAMFESEEQRLAAELESVRGKQEAADILLQTNRVLAAQKLTFAANGLDVGFGTPVAVAENTGRAADIQVSAARSDAVLRQVARRRQARELMFRRDGILSAGKFESGASRTEGLGRGAMTAFDLALRRLDRG